MPVGSSPRLTAISDRLELGWRLVFDSLGLLRSTPRLLLFPLAAVSVAILSLPVFVAAGLFVGGWPALSVALLWYALVAKFVSTYCGAALVVGVARTINGQPLDVGTCLAAANRRFGRLCAWSTSTVLFAPFLFWFGIRHSEGRAARPQLQYPWKVLLFFALPTILFEDVSGSRILWRSLGLYENTREAILGAGFVTLAGSTAVVTPLLVVAAGLARTFTHVLPVRTWLVGAVGLLLASALVVLSVQTINGVVRTALYLHDADDRELPQFDSLDRGRVESRAEQTTTAGSSNAEADD